MSHRRTLLGIDIGSTSVKVVVLDEGFRVLGAARTEYATDTDPTGRSTQDPEQWWRAAAQGLSDIRSRGVTTDAVCAVGVT